MARRTTRLVAVSEEIRDELVALGVAPADRFAVIRLGFDLAPFLADSAARERQRAAVRAELGIPAEARVVTLVARLVPIKRVDRFLRVASRLREETGIRFLIVGDGELREELLATPEAHALGDLLLWTGFRRDMPALCFASDVVVLTSDNEGTPVSLIEAQAAGVPVVSAAVGGVRAVIEDGKTGQVTPPEEDAIADAIRAILRDERLRERMGARGRTQVVKRFSIDRLVSDIDSLYRRSGCAPDCSAVTAAAAGGLR